MWCCLFLCRLKQPSSHQETTNRWRSGISRWIPPQLTPRPGSFPTSWGWGFPSPPKGTGWLALGKPLLSAQASTRVQGVPQIHKLNHADQRRTFFNCWEKKMINYKYQWAWVWVNSGSWWWTGSLGKLQSMGSQTVGHDWATELNWTEQILYPVIIFQDRRQNTFSNERKLKEFVARPSLK